VAFVDRQVPHHLLNLSTESTSELLYYRRMIREALIGVLCHTIQSGRNILTADISGIANVFSNNILFIGGLNFISGGRPPSRPNSLFAALQCTPGFSNVTLAHLQVQIETGNVHSPR
jgi:hypothetical protein